MTDKSAGDAAGGSDWFRFPDRLVLLREHWQAMLDHITACLPEEGCGLLAGQLEGGVARCKVVIPIPNELHSPVRFRMDPARQVEAFIWLENQGFELAAIFHSHPVGPPIPSATDLSEFAYPGVLTLIWSPLDATGEWRPRAFRIENGQAGEVPIELLDSAEDASDCDVRG